MDYKEIEHHLLEILQRNPSEYKHAKDTLDYLVLLQPQADASTRIASLAHDIERVVYGEDHHTYSSHKEFKLAHAQRSAECTDRILSRYSISQEDREKVFTLIQNHEFSEGLPSIVCDADSLANLVWCDDNYGKRDSVMLKETMKRMYWRMSEENRHYAHDIQFKNPEIKAVFEEILQSP